LLHKSKAGFSFCDFHRRYWKSILKSLLTKNATGVIQEKKHGTG